jgi:hypothetical protein
MPTSLSSLRAAGRGPVVRSASQLDRGEVHALFQSAIRHSGARFPKTGAIRLVLESASKKKPSAS